MKKISMVTTFLLLLSVQPCIYLMMYHNKVQALKHLYLKKQLKTEKLVEKEDLILPVVAFAKNLFY